MARIQTPSGPGDDHQEATPAKRRRLGEELDMASTAQCSELPAKPRDRAWRSNLGGDELNQGVRSGQPISLTLP